MAKTRWMQKFARWHIWLGWVVGVPVVMWTVTGLFMVSRPIEQVRGNDLMVEQPTKALPPDMKIGVTLPASPTKPVLSVATAMDGSAPVTSITYTDGSVQRFAPDGTLLPSIDAAAAREIVARKIVGGGQVSAIRYFAANNVPQDFRRSLGVWQVSLNDGTHVYVARDTGAIEAIRTRWWRAFDFMWGLHIMDLQDREDTSHPILILFSALSVIGTLLGAVLMFRRRKARVTQ